MDKAFFQKQIDRLAETFGANQYKPERIKLIWNEVSHLSEEWLRNTVDHFIGDFRLSPLVPDFRKEIILERERLWNLEKSKHTRDTLSFSGHTYADEEIKFICEQIRKSILKAS
jgi:hypothetical protein